MLKYGADTLITESLGLTALDLAFQQGNSQAIELLQQHNQ